LAERWHAGSRYIGTATLRWWMWWYSMLPVKYLRKNGICK
jgi:hypothetical protein